VRRVYAEDHAEQLSEQSVEFKGMAALKKIESDLLKLPIKARARLAARLIESLDDEPENEREKAWLAEAARRDAELSSGKIEGVPVERVFKRVKSALR
jgi:putative addiction module component (TIGR02574 family)